MKKVFCILLCAAMLCSGFLAAAAPAVEQKSVVIEVEYYDEGVGHFQIMYDSLTREERYGEIKYLEATNKWTTATFYIEDAYFGNRVQGQYDFLLTILAPQSTSVATRLSTASVAVRSVKVTKYPAANPVTHYGYTDEPGNTFPFYQEEKILHNDFTNTTDKAVNAKVTYRAVNQGGVEKWRTTESLFLEPKEKKTVDVNVDSDWCDLYTLYVDVEDATNGISSHYKRYNFAIIKTDPDGIKNEKFYYAAHLNRWFDTADEGAKVMARSNAEGVRQEFGWAAVEPSSSIGTFVYPEEQQRLHQILKNNNLDLMAIFAFGVSSYTGGFTYLPETDQEIQRWSEAMEYVVETVGDWVTRIEIWNEPNIAMFNGGTGGTSINVRTPPEGYAKAAIAAYKAAKRVNPDIQVGVLSLCGLTAENSYNWFRRAMSAGLWEYCDAITMHPYGASPTEQDKFADVLKKYQDIWTDELKIDKELPPFWNTEVGFSRGNDESATYQRQSNNDVRSYLYLQGESVEECHVNYNFEQKGVVEYQREDVFGKVSPGAKIADYEFDKNYVPRLAYMGITGMNYIMAKATPDGHGNYGNTNETYIYKYNSEKFGNDVMALWSLAEKSQSVTLDLGVNSLTYSDGMGNMTTIESKDGKYSFRLCGTPFYLLGDFAKVEVCEEQKITWPAATVNAAINDVAVFTIEKSAEMGDLQIRADLPADAKFVSEPVFDENGKAQVKIQLGEEITDETTMRFYIEEDGVARTISNIDFNIVTVTADAYMDVNLRDGKDMNKWNGYVRITNRSNTKVTTGNVEFLSPSEFTATGKVKIGRIPCGKTAEVKIPFPDITRKGIYNVEYRINLDSGQSYDFTDRVDFTVAAYRTGDIKIDGYIDEGEWEQRTWMYADQADSVSYMATEFVGTWDGPKDCSVKTTVQWDEENYYMLTVVNDDIQYSEEYEPSMSYMGDDIQFAIYHDINQYIAAGQAGIYFNEFGASLSNRGPALYKWRVQTDATVIGDINDPSCEVMVRHDEAAKQTIYEVKMPWNYMFGYEYSPKAGEYVGFSYLVNENDGNGRALGMKYADGITGGKNANLFCKLMFIK